MNFNSDCNVKISEDGMSAMVYLTPPMDGEKYTKEDIADFLRKNGVSYGIISNNIESLIEAGTYYYDIEVAKGTEPVDGTDGYYDFYFSGNEKRKPVIRSDGSVDYQSMNVIQNVRKGDKLAFYHNAIPCVHGKDVRGKEFRAKPGRELPALRGAGFEVSYDGLTYTALNDGKVEYDEYKLYVRDVYELKGDLDLVTGKIDFRGDVIIHGNVLTGTSIRASKSITVEGSVEAATLIAEGDIILKKGVHGGKKAKISAGKTVYANFIEFSQVEAKENVEANIIFNSVVTAGRDIVISGKKGAIVGGLAKANGRIKATFLGNQVGVKTMAKVGAGPELERRFHLLNMKASSSKDSIAKTLVEVQRMRANVAMDEYNKTKLSILSQLNRRKEREERLLEHIEKELLEIGDIMALARDAKISIENTAYKLSNIMVDDKEKTLNEDMKNVEFYRKSTLDDISVRNAI